MTLFLITAGVILLSMAFLGIRILVLPDGEFHGTCSTNNEFQDHDCGCQRKEANLCPSADEEGLLQIQELTNPGRKTGHSLSHKDHS
jgi:hypothetical protein